VGTAGWAIPASAANSFSAEGTALTRYAGRFNAVEINSTFYRPHRRSTYENWAASVPAEFRFAVKMRKTVTHELRLVNTDRELEVFLNETSALGPKLGPLLIQLPPSLRFDFGVASRFFRAVRSAFAHQIACEPRHPTWFSEEAGQLLEDYQVTRVAADPARAPEWEESGGWTGFRYIRLHGSPRMYYSSYSKPYLTQLAARLAARGVETWCIFDNTASGAACENALQVIGTAVRP
jgi:uncharacterized protein YecE (DUF72 family)